MVFELFKVGFICFNPLMSADSHAPPEHLNVVFICNVCTVQNAMRATMELHGDALEYPPIHTQVALGSEDLTVKVRLALLRRRITRQRAHITLLVHVILSRWATAEEACRCARSTGCSPTRTPRLRCPASTAPALLPWSVLLLYGYQACTCVWTLSALSEPQQTSSLIFIWILKVFIWL